MSNKNTCIAFVLLLVLITGAYWNHFSNSFHFDDSHTIVDNIYIRNLNNAARFFIDPQTFSALPANQSYRPLVTLSYAIDYRIGGGLNPFSFHLSMFFLFLLQLVFMFFLFRKLLCYDFSKKTSNLISCLAVGFYGIHTAIAETINYISARSDSYSTFFMVCSFVFFLSFRAGFLKWFYLLPLLLALLTKEQAAMFPAILFCYCLLYERPLDFSQLLSKYSIRQVFHIFIVILPSLLLCIAILYWSITRAEQWSPGGKSSLHYLLTQAFVQVHYLLTFVLPINLSADYDWELIKSARDDRFLIGVATIVAVMSYAFQRTKEPKGRAIAFGVAWYFLALAPTSTIIPLAEPLNDHRLFFPYVGLTLSAGVFLWNLWNSKRFPGFLKKRSITLILLVSVFSLHFYGVRNRCAVWKTGESLWYNVTQTSPRNARGHMNYGLSQMRKGKYESAEISFLEAAKLWPRYNVIYINLGVLNGKLGRQNQAESNFKKAVRLSSGNPQGHFFYARWLYEQGRIGQAIHKAQRALALSPAYIDPHELLIEIHEKKGNLFEAKRWALKTLKLDRNNKKAQKILK